MRKTQPVFYMLGFKRIIAATALRLNLDLLEVQTQLI